MDEPMDEPTPMMTEEEMPAETEEDMADDDEAPMPVGGTSVQVAETGLGPIMVGPEGMTLYMFANDGPGESACYDSCATTWPPFLVEDGAVAGEGVDPSLLGTTERTNGDLQLTYNGMPLYYYAPDSAPGDTNGQGIGGVWYVVNPAGEAVTAAPGEDLPDY
jgi:predicted lipoprotein with Yx(FWY)xxD motif